MEAEPPVLALEDEYLNVIASAPNIQDVIRTIKKIVNTQAAVLLRGERGTGKEALAQIIHQLGSNNTKKIAIFTKAAERSPKGIMSFLNTDTKIGTFFIEELADLSLTDQHYLENYLKNQRKCDQDNLTRIVASTSKELQEMIREGRFRSYLFYRFFVLEIPPLRERKEDVLHLANFFIKIYSVSYKKPVREFSPEGTAALLSYHWPENIPELENLVQKALLISDTEAITPDDLGLNADGLSSDILNFYKAMEVFKKEFTRSAIERFGPNLTRVAERIGVSRPTLYDMIDKFGLRLKSDKG